MKIRIFVIDDESSIRDTFKYYLEDLGYEVFVASEPSLSEIYVEQNWTKENPCYDIVLTDYSMPNMNGLEFVESIMKRGCNVHPLNIFIMSGNTKNIDMDKVHAIGCQVVQKPLSFWMLDQLIHKSKERVGSGMRGTLN